MIKGNSMLDFLFIILLSRWDSECSWNCEWFPMLYITGWENSSRVRFPRVPRLWPQLQSVSVPRWHSGCYSDSPWLWTSTETVHRPAGTSAAHRQPAGWNSRETWCQLRTTFLPRTRDTELSWCHKSCELFLTVIFNDVLNHVSCYYH